MNAIKLKISANLRIQNTLSRMRFLLFSVAKRIMDVCLVSLCMLVMSPLLLCVIVSLKSESKGSVFFKQRRIGRYKEPFTMYKFRSVHADAESRRIQLEANNESAAGVM